MDENHGSCSDAGTGTSESAPWCRLHRATDGVVTSEGGTGGPYTPVVAGDVVYVKNGTYADTTTATPGDPAVKFQPTNSGSVGNPIAFRAYPGHAPVITRNIVALDPGTTTGNMPVAGTAGGQDYIVWDGFTTGAYTDFRLDGCTDCILENLLIDKGQGYNPSGTGNYTGIFIQNSVNPIIRNNRVRNVRDASDTWQAVGIVSYDTTNAEIRNNELGPGNTVCMHDKRGASNNDWYRNWCHETTAGGIGFFWGSSGSATATNGTFVYENVFERIGDICVYSPSDSNSQNFQLWNNTCLGVASSSGMRIGMIFNPNPSTAPTIRLSNNLIMRDETAVGSNYGHLVFQGGGVGPPADLVSNYQAFYGNATTDAVFRPAAGGGTETLTQWQTRGYDTVAVTAAPQLTGPFPATNPAAFKPAAGSPLLGAGRVGGVSGGAVVNIGAYTNDTVCIGPESACPPTVIGVPGSVRGLWVQPGVRF